MVLPLPPGLILPLPGVPPIFWFDIFSGFVPGVNMEDDPVVPVSANTTLDVLVISSTWVYWVGKDGSHCSLSLILSRNVEKFWRWDNCC